MRPLTKYQDINDRDAARLDHDVDVVRAQRVMGDPVAPHSRTRRVVGSLRRVYREVNAANAAVDRMNRPWVYQGRDVHSPRKSTRRTSR